MRYAVNISRKCCLQHAYEKISLSKIKSKSLPSHSRLAEYLLVNHISYFLPKSFGKFVFAYSISSGTMVMPTSLSIRSITALNKLELPIPACITLIEADSDDR